MKEKGVAMPQSLVVEIDNTAREGKNQHFATFEAALVGRDVFEAAQTESGFVGHTHNGQDQRFSTIATVLAKAPELEDPNDFKDTLPNDNVDTRVSKNSRAIVFPVQSLCARRSQSMGTGNQGDEII